MLLEKYLKYTKSSDRKELYVMNDNHFGNMDDFDPKVIDQFGWFAVGVIIVFAGIILGLSMYIAYS